MHAVLQRPSWLLPAPQAPVLRCGAERGVSVGILLLAACLVLAVAAGAQESPARSSRLVYASLPPEAVRAGCPLPAMPMQRAR